VGSMLFRSLGFGGETGVGAGGGGIGLFDIAVVLGLLFLLFKFFQSRRSSLVPVYAAGSNIAQGSGVPVDFDSARFKETAQDIFFKVQGAWTRGDLSLVKSGVSPETLALLQQDLDGLKSRRETNRLENIAVREVEITESWQEAGSDYLTVRFLASLLDYNTDESGKVVSGSDADPVKFEEYWTFLRTSGATNPWVLTAIQQSPN
ncbi:Tim44 domain-containing protein, partial [Bdellovibrionota bacterium FG-2]